MEYKAAGVVLRKENRYLLVQENKEGVKGLWNWPAGRCEVGETPEATAIRETQEETGFTIEILKKIGDWPTLSNSGYRTLFLGNIIEGKLSFPEQEIQDAKWFTKDEITAMKDILQSPWIVEGIEALNIPL